MYPQSADPFNGPSLTEGLRRYESRTWHQLGVSMVLDELRELNILNRWHNLLRRWHAWNDVLAGYTEHEAWTLRKEFIESDAHQVPDLSQRNARRNWIRSHQRRAPATPCNRKHVSRQARSRPAGTGPDAATAQTLKYREKTLDYRNEHSHAIGPSLEIGHTQFVHPGPRMQARPVEPVTEQTPQIPVTSRQYSRGTICPTSQLLQSLPAPPTIHGHEGPSHAASTTTETPGLSGRRTCRAPGEEGAWRILRCRGCPHVRSSRCGDGAVLALDAACQKVRPTRQLR